LGHPTAIDGSGDGQVVVPIDDFLLAGALAALFEQLNGILAFGFSHGASFQMVAVATAVYPLFGHNMEIPMRPQKGKLFK
jgi:hypothetical protein